MTYREEFPDYDAATLPAIPADWVDSSWHNDACPCWQVGADMFVYVDYADSALREFSGMPRFSILQHDDAGTESLLETDDWQQVLQFVTSKVSK